MAIGDAGWFAQIRDSLASGRQKSHGFGNVLTPQEQQQYELFKNDPRLEEYSGSGGQREFRQKGTGGASAAPTPSARASSPIPNSAGAYSPIPGAVAAPPPSSGYNLPSVPSTPANPNQAPVYGPTLQATPSAADSGSMAESAAAGIQSEAGVGWAQPGASSAIAARLGERLPRASASYALDMLRRRIY